MIWIDGELLYVEIIVESGGGGYADDPAVQ
jgi:hypothetical protein